MSTDRSVYMQQYRVRYGLTKRITVPVDVLASVIDTQSHKPLAEWLGESMAQTLLDVADDNK